VTKNAVQSVAYADALLALKYSRAAAHAAHETVVAANSAASPVRATNVLALLAGNARQERRIGARHEVVIRSTHGDVALAGMAAVAKYGLATANATRYAADAAENAGARHAANRARRAAGRLESMARMAEWKAATSVYSPLTALMTARAARAASVQAARAASAAGPVGPSATRIMGLALIVLPRGDRERYLEEWVSEMWGLPPGWARLRSALSILRGAPGLGLFLRTKRIGRRLWRLTRDRSPGTAAVRGGIIAGSAHSVKNRRNSRGYSRVLSVSGKYGRANSRTVRPLRAGTWSLPLLPRGTIRCPPPGKRGMTQTVPRQRGMAVRTPCSGSL